MVVFPHFLSVPNPICALTLCARALSHRPRCDREEFFCAMFCFPTNVEARCWCVVVIIFLHNGKRVIKGNKSRREKYVVFVGCVSSERPCLLCGLDDSTREYQHKVLLLFWSFLFTPTNNHGTRRERIWIFFFIITFFIIFCIIPVSYTHLRAHET